MYEKSYGLKRMLWAPPVIVIFFAMAAYYFYVSALRNDSIDLYRVIRLTAPASTYVFWSFFVIATGFVVLGIFLFFALLQGKRVVVLSGSSIMVPEFSWSGVRHIEIPFSSIKRLEPFQAGNGFFLNIHHAHGRSTLAKAAFMSASDFQSVYAALAAEARR